jgi:ribosomal protein L24
VAQGPHVQVGEFIGILRGKLRGKKGRVHSVGVVFVHVIIPGEDGIPIVKKEDIIRIVESRK